MLISRRCLFLIFAITAAILGFSNIQHGQSAQTLAVRDSTLAPIDDETEVVLPKEGKIDDRTFFSSMRHPVIEYPDRQTTEVVADLVSKVDDGSVRLRFDKDSGYLMSVLELLHVPVETQTVLFSKTSLQGHYISPSNPRALFYTDEVAVGFIRNAPLLEIAALDKQQGVVFYAIDQKETDTPHIKRHDSCLSCHLSHRTLDVPGMLVRSVGSGVGGELLTEYGDYLSDHRSPFAERWGGWFITGKMASFRNMGNKVLATDAPSGAAVGSTQALASLDGKFNPAGYPTRYSDVAAVLVLNHQVRMTNLMTRVAWETRIALDQQKKNPREKETAERLIAADARELADYILFADEAPFPGKFESTSGFQATFEAGGIKDRRGRSLKQLDLSQRLLRYPCSYMIYSHAFDGLPPAARDAVYARMWDVLSGKDKSPKYSKLSPADRAAIVDILVETKTGFPAYFRKSDKL
jgi:hypothetical protein